MITALATIFYFILGAFLRRWYGGGFDEKYKWLGNRGLQTVVMLAAFMSIYVKNPTNWICLLAAGVISCWLMFQYFSRGHGAEFDIGRDEKPIPETIKRYNERWYHIPCDFLFDKIIKRPEAKYGFLYDFLYMGLRYTCPMIPMMFIDWRYILIGLSIAPIYAFCWTLWEQEEWSRTETEWLNKPVKWAELWLGGVTYAGCYLLGV